nr:transposase [Testudinibacter sp. TR-2022]
MDTTFFGREFGILVLMDSITEKVIFHRVVSTEKALYYRLAINELREKNYYIQSITCDGKRGLLKDLLNAPIQMCQFHQVALVIRKLTRKPKSEAGKALKILVKTLKISRKNEFYINLYHWYLKHKTFLNERSDKPDEKGKYPYKHRGVRSAYASLLRNMDHLFTFEKYAELNIEKTTNRLEGLFSELKRNLAAHNGLTKYHKIMFIKDFLNKKGC